jgi:hypothetical protein
MVPSAVLRYFPVGIGPSFRTKPAWSSRSTGSPSVPSAPRVVRAEIA